MATKKMTPKKTNKNKAKKLEATKPLAVNAFAKIDGMSSE